MAADRRRGSAGGGGGAGVLLLGLLGHGGVRGRAEGALLEASMHSSMLTDVQEAAALMGAAPPAGIPDSSAVVGQVFQLKVPMETPTGGSTLKVTEAGKASLPSWLHWDPVSGVLQGLPLEADRGNHYISVSVADGDGSRAPPSPDVFSIEVHPEEHADGPAPAAEAPPFWCSGEEPVTVLTVILDADLTKLSALQRVELMRRMQRFSAVPLQRMRLQPVVNNRLFDMSAFMAGPGNAKKVVETGALLSWRLGCALEPGQVPDLSGVQRPAKEGAMSAVLGHPWPKTSPTKKPRKPKTSTPPPPRAGSPKAPPPTAQAHGHAPVPGQNQKPDLRNPIDQVSVWVGSYFEVKIPSDTFYDREDGPTDHLRLTLRLKQGGEGEGRRRGRGRGRGRGGGSWIQFNSSSQLLFGLPEPGHEGTHECFLQATDKGGRSASDAFEVRVRRHPSADHAPVLFAARFQGDPQTVTANVQRKIALVKRLALALGTGTAAPSAGPLPPSPTPWSPTSTPSATRERRRELPQLLLRPAGRPGPRPPPPPTPSAAPGRQSADDVYLHTVIPAVVVAAILLIAGVIAMICYRKKRRGKLTVEDQATFIKKGVPIIFADELDDPKAPPPPACPSSCRRRSPLPPRPSTPTPPAQRPRPSTRDCWGVLRAAGRDPNAPPTSPPPFLTPLEGKGSRPKNMTPYRSPIRAPHNALGFPGLSRSGAMGCWEWRGRWGFGGTW
ncbi:hypothetical protein ANANG_G00229830 [Anguilla anguilla]|uniref:Dystroglycan 1 n=1 Tax=Anguilla anguilla TaxID=7936 RepID=A0A9D3LXZ4_ANGAN|nr:hypothetical protein ANANG_G00229830 [Anguilla anguilla]